MCVGFTMRITSSKRGTPIPWIKKERAIGDRIKLNRYPAGNWGGGGRNRSKVWYVFMTVNCWINELIDGVTELVIKWLIGRDRRFGPACCFFSGNHYWHFLRLEKQVLDYCPIIATLFNLHNSLLAPTKSCTNFGSFSKQTFNILNERSKL